MMVVLSATLMRLTSRRALVARPYHTSAGTAN